MLTPVGSTARPIERTCPVHSAAYAGLCVRTADLTRRAYADAKAGSQQPGGDFAYRLPDDGRARAQDIDEAMP
jgi:hypothetical protein